MKTILKYITRIAAMMMKLFGTPFLNVHTPSGAEEPVIAKQTADELMLTNVFLLLKEYPDFAVKTEDVRLLRRRLKRFERMQLRGGPAAATALKQLQKQWKRVVRNKMMMIEKESDRPGPTDKNINPVSGSSVCAHADEPGLSTSSGLRAGNEKGQVAAVKTAV